MDLLRAFLNEDLSYEKTVTAKGTSKKAQNIQHRIRKGFKASRKHLDRPRGRYNTKEYERQTDNIGSDGYAYHKRGNRAKSSYYAFMKDYGISLPSTAKRGKVAAVNGNVTSLKPKKYFDKTRELEKRRKSQKNTKKVQKKGPLGNEPRVLSHDSREIGRK